jgi:Flp pilus assembly protein TadG
VSPAQFIARVTGRGARTVVQHGGGDDAGSSDALGLALLAPAAIGLAVVIVFLGRGVDGRATTQMAAEAAAQAAAQERTPAAADRAAREVGTRVLVDHDSCASPSMVVDTSDFVPGGQVAVTVSCTTSTRGLELIAPPSGRAGSATAYATIDLYRGMETAP